VKDLWTSGEGFVDYRCGLSTAGEDLWTAGEDLWTAGEDLWTAGEDLWTAGGEDLWTAGEDLWTAGEVCRLQVKTCGLQVTPVQPFTHGQRQ